MGMNQRTAKSYLSSTGDFNTSVAGTTKAGTTLPVFGSPAIDPGSLCANVTTGITTSTLTMTAKWQGSNDGTTFNDIRVPPGTAYTNVSAAGTGSLVTTNYIFPYPHGLPSYPYVRCVLVNAVATGGAGDTWTISYNFVRRDYQ